MTDATGRTTTTYDDLNRVATVTNPAAKRITYSYTALSQRRVMIEPEAGRFSYIYDDAARLKYLENPQNQRTSYTYDSASRVTVQKLANGTRASYTYDDDNRVTRLANLTSTPTTLSSFDYSYDSVGNRTRVLETGGIRVTWSYDNLYRLTRARRNGANSYDTTHTYDPVGNRLVKIEDAARTTSTYDAANQIRRSQDSSGITTSTYDATGNLSVVRDPSNQRTTHTWDTENRLTLVKLPSGTRNTFAYNGTGLRTQKQDSAGTSKFIWDGQNVLAETDGSNVTQVIYTLAPATYGNLISQRRSGTTKHYHFDAIGSTDRLTDGGQTVTDSYLYDPWGKIKTSTGSTVNPFRFVGLQGYFYDLDLLEYYLRARFYDPRCGRFLSQDPLMFVIQTNGQYQYAMANSMRLVDPSGLQCCLPSGSAPCVSTPSPPTTELATSGVPTSSSAVTGTATTGTAVTGTATTGTAATGTAATGTAATGTAAIGTAATGIAATGIATMTYSYVSSQPTNYIDPSGLAKITPEGQWSTRVRGTKHPTARHAIGRQFQFVWEDPRDAAFFVQEVTDGGHFRCLSVCGEINSVQWTESYVEAFGFLPGARFPHHATDEHKAGPQKPAQHIQAV